jgi:hypothetical protein
MILISDKLHIWKLKYIENVCFFTLMYFVVYEIQETIIIKTHSLLLAVLDV